MATTSELLTGLLLIKAATEEIIAKVEAGVDFNYDEEFKRKLLALPQEWIDGGKAGLEGP